MKKILLSMLVISLLVTVFSPLNSALAVETDVKKDCKYGDSVISESTLNEKEKEQFNNEKADYMDLSLEIANSDLEERAIISSQNGHVKNAFRSAKEANVSEEAFQHFEYILVEMNNSVDNGEISFGETLFDIQHSNLENKSVEKNRTFTTQTTYYYISHSKAVKAQKLLAAGAGIALLASELGLPTVVAAGLAALAAGAGLCDWYDKGFYMYKYGPNLRIGVVFQKNNRFGMM